MTSITPSGDEIAERYAIEVDRLERELVAVEEKWRASEKRVAALEAENDLLRSANSAGVKPADDEKVHLEVVVRDKEAGFRTSIHASERLKRLPDALWNILVDRGAEAVKTATIGYMRERYGRHIKQVVGK